MLPLFQEPGPCATSLTLLSLHLYSTLSSERSAICEPTAVCSSPIGGALGLTQAPPFPRGPPRFHRLDLSFFSQSSQNTPTASIITSPVPQGDQHPFGRQGWVGDFLGRLSAFPSWRAYKIHYTGHRKLSPGLRQREWPSGTDLSRSVCCRS